MAEEMFDPSLLLVAIHGSADDFPKHRGLPRGCFEELLQLFEKLAIRTEVIDERSMGHPIQASFVGNLRPEQREAAGRLLRFDEGLLCAPTAFGKTAVAIWLIPERRVNTLVHRGQLLDQWRERLASFLNAGGIHWTNRRREGADHRPN